MRDLILKLRMLRLMNARIWYREVWLRDPNALMCCNGYMCGCQGATNREYWEAIGVYDGTAR